MQLKTTRKCLPYASKSSVSILASWSWIITVIRFVTAQLFVCLLLGRVCALERIKPFLSRFTFLSMQWELCEHIKRSPCHPPPFFCCDPMNYFCQKNKYGQLVGSAQETGCPSRVSSTIKENKKRQSDLIPSSLVIAWGFCYDPDGPGLCFSV